MKHNVLFIILIIILTACSTHSGRYSQKHDSTPSREPYPSELIDAIPRDESPSRGGNKNYTVRGKHYNVLSTSKNFKETGIASWYGSKFHGHLTSNGEIYNMYGMTAAHKNLPLPTYVKVTNNNNNKSVIVRVNDRGPFHQSRIIDLSYSAAYKIDMLKTGTASVTVEVIDLKNNIKKSQASTLQNNIKKDIHLNATNNYIQILATQSRQSAIKQSVILEQQFNTPNITTYSNGVYRVKLGPFSNKIQLKKVLQKVRANGYPKAFKSKIK